jgi:UDP-3-O-acyl-N-acetylglucosamine deacetylase
MLFVCRRTLRAFSSASDAAASGSDPNQLIAAEPAGAVVEHGLLYVATDEQGAVRVTADAHTVVSWSLCTALQIEICTVEPAREARGRIFRVA